MPEKKVKQKKEPEFVFAITKGRKIYFDKRVLEPNTAYRFTLEEFKKLAKMNAVNKVNQ